MVHEQAFSEWIHKRSRLNRIEILKPGRKLFSMFKELPKHQIDSHQATETQEHKIMTMTTGDETAYRLIAVR
jgi:hypothetical protein